MKVKTIHHFILLSLPVCFYLFSCTQEEEKAKPAISTRGATDRTAPVIELTEPKLNASGKIDTSQLTCYINTYVQPFLVKIDNRYYEVKANDLPNFISYQKEELRKYRIHLLNTKNTSYKKVIELHDLLMRNNIKDFEEVVDGVLQK